MWAFLAFFPLIRLGNSDRVDFLDARIKDQRTRQVKDSIYDYLKVKNLSRGFEKVCNLTVSVDHFIGDVSGSSRTVFFTKV